MTYNHLLDNGGVETRDWMCGTFVCWLIVIANIDVVVIVGPLWTH